MKPGNIEAEIRRTLRAGPLSSVQIAKRLGRTRQTVFTCLRAMVDAGAAEVVDEPSDRRSVYWRLKANETSGVKPE